MWVGEREREREREREKKKENKTKRRRRKGVKGLSVFILKSYLLLSTKQA